MACSVERDGAALLPLDGLDPGRPPQGHDTKRRQPRPRKVGEAAAGGGSAVHTSSAYAGAQPPGREGAGAASWNLLVGRPAGRARALVRDPQEICHYICIVF